LDFNFSANTGYLWKELPFIDRLKMAKRHAFRSLEFHDEPHKENLAGLKNLLSEIELNVNGMNARMGDTFGCAAIPDQSDKARNEIKDAITIAEDLGAKALHILSGVTEYNKTSISTYISNLNFALDNSKISILIEPVCEEQLSGYFLRTIDQAAAIIDKIDHPRLKIMFDCYHIYKESGDLVKNFADHADKIGHVQIAAAENRAEPFPGALNYSDILPEFKRLGYQGAFGCEYRPSGSTEGGLGWRDPFFKMENRE
jgi:hydroxypyruvate isomerase